MIDPADRLRIASMARLRFDDHSKQWLLLYPERGLSLSATAATILSLCDGVRTVGEVTAALRATYESGADALERDVMTFLQLLSEKGLVERA